MLASAVFWATLVCIGYLLLIIGVYAVLAVFAALESVLRGQQRRAEDFETLERSRLTPPVSVLVPVYNEAEVIEPVLDSLLALRYPELEIVVVNDGSTDGTLEILRDRYALRRRERFYRRQIGTRALRAIYASEKHPHLCVVDKVNGGKADALNAAMNLARYPHVCCVDGDTIYREDALLKTMRLVTRDPERLIGVTAQVAVSSRPEQDAGAGQAEPLDRTVLANFQHIEYQRSFLNNRLAWSRFGFMLCASGAFSIWRRDVLEEVGGFSPTFTCEDIELTFRMHEHHLRRRRDYAIVSIPDVVAVTEGPARLGALVAQRARWQRVMLETIWSYRHMLLNRRYGLVGAAGMPLYLASEVLAPVFELLSIVTLVAGLVLGVVAWPVYVVVLVTIMLANATLFAAAILLDDATSRAYRLRHVVHLLLLGLAELVAYRPILVFARFKGTWGFLRGRRCWNKFDRNRRPSTPTGPGKRRGETEAPRARKASRPRPVFRQKDAIS